MGLSVYNVGKVNAARVTNGNTANNEQADAGCPAEREDITVNDELTRLVDGGERLELTLLQVLAVHDKLRPAYGRLLTHRTLRFALAAERYFGRPDIRLNLERETIDHIFSEASR